MFTAREASCWQCLCPVDGKDGRLLNMKRVKRQREMMKEQKAFII
jgi:hypothetical protein